MHQSLKIAVKEGGLEDVHSALTLCRLAYQVFNAITLFLQFFESDVDTFT